MQQLFEYYGRYQGLKGSVQGLPGWARSILVLFALPGILAVGLSILAVLCSLAALLLITVPVYRILRMLTHRPATGPWEPNPVVASPARRHVDVKIIE